MRKNVVTTAAIRRVKVWSACVAVCACSFGLFSCDDYDDTDIRNDIENLEDRVAALEEWQQSVNTNIQSLQGLVEALESRDYITGVTPIVEGDEEVGYTITFQNGEPITIKNGENGSTPVIGIAKDTDGTYYWTLGGEALTDEDGKARTARMPLLRKCASTRRATNGKSRPTAARPGNRPVSRQPVRKARKGQPVQRATLSSRVWTRATPTVSPSRLPMGRK